LNVAFHALAGLAIGQAAATRVSTPPRQGLARGRDAVVTTIAFGLAIMSHGILDGLPHEYPLRALGDLLATTAVVAAGLWLIQPRFRILLLVTLLGAVLPDVIDHTPRDLNRHLGTHLPELKKVFPWHGAGGSGSLSGDNIVFRAHIASLTNHVMVVAFCATVLWLTRRVWRVRPRVGLGADHGNPQAP
jgi:hypothetical protein